MKYIIIIGLFFISACDNKEHLRLSYELGCIEKLHKMSENNQNSVPPGDGRKAQILDCFTSSYDFVEKYVK